jgi:hypothetical protein
MAHSFGSAKHISSVLVAVFGLMSFGTSAVGAQQAAGASAKQLQGHWSLVSLTSETDGKKFEPLGANPKGLLIFDPSGRYSLQLFRSELPKFASNSRETGTAEENKAIVQGTLSHFGIYTVNEKDSTFTMRPEASSFPNWTGVEQPARKFAISGDQLTYSNPASSRGGGSNVLILKRLK